MPIIYRSAAPNIRCMLLLQPVGYKFWVEGAAYWRLCVIVGPDVTFNTLAEIDWHNRRFYPSGPLAHVAPETLPPEVSTLKQAMDYVAAVAILEGT